MKRNIIFPILISAAILAGCKQDSNPAGNSETPAASAPAEIAAPINLPMEIARAKAENKLVFMDFTGSDWCPACIIFHQKVFSQPEFIAYAKSNLVFIEVDFPQKIQLPPANQSTNKFLAEQFGINPLPTLIALDGDGKEIWRMPTKDDQNPSIPTSILNPQGFIALLEALKKKQP